MSEALKHLQEKVGCDVVDGSFGPNTARKIVAHYELSKYRGAHLLGQVHHESGGFKKTKESLYYSTPERIQAVWPSRFPTVASAEPYAKNPEKLAGKVYAGRMQNRDEAEAAKFLGRGFLQVTGRQNHRAFASDMRLPEVLDNPALLEKEYAFESAVWFFRANKLFEMADKGISEDNIKKITRRINGGYHGLDDRIEQTNKIFNWIYD